MWHPPRHLGHLHLALLNADFDLLEHLRDHVRQLLVQGKPAELVHRSHLLIRVLVHNITMDRAEGFCLLAHHSIGEIGEALGLLWPRMGAADGARTKRFPEVQIDPDRLQTMPLTPANFALSFDRDTVRHWVGREAVSGRVVAFGDPRDSVARCRGGHVFGRRD